MRVMKTYLFLAVLMLSSCKNRQNIDTIGLAEEEILLWENYVAKDNSKGKHIVLVSGDEEYRSEEALPQLAKILSEQHGFDCTVLFAQDPDKPGVINPNYRKNIPGMHLLEEADLVVWFTRFRALPAEQMEYFESYLLQGGPMLAIRTSTHAFNIEDDTSAFSHYSWNYKGNKEEWHAGFGKKILGETWFTHHGHHKHQSTRGIFPDKTKPNEILNGIENGSIWGPTDVYGVRTPIEGDAEIVLYGQTIDRKGEYDMNDIFYGMRETDSQIATEVNVNDDVSYDPNKTMPPIVWKKSYQLKGGKEGKTVTSTIGSSTDLLDEEVRRLFVNSSYYLLDMSIPKKAKVDLVGIYNPTAFKFQDDVYWEQKNLRIGQ